MKSAKEEVAKPLIASLLIVWAITLPACIVIDLERDAYFSGYGVGGDISAPISMMIMSPEVAVLYAAIISLLTVIHWWLCGLFCETGMASRPISNGLLVITCMLLILLLFERSATDFRNFSLFCSATEPNVVILVDKIHRCERSMRVLSIIDPLCFLLPILTIPIRIFESRLGATRA